MIKEKMTPRELAAMTGYSRQTINKWVHKENWTTSKKQGVQGGRARLIHIDERVQEFIRNTRRISDVSGRYNANETSLEAVFINAIGQMSNKEQQRMAAMLLRDGIAGVLTRLGIRDSE